MPLIFTRDEIKDILANMGYEDIGEEALARFILDLKRLIKHEDIKRRRKRLGHDSTATKLSTTPSDSLTSTGITSSSESTSIPSSAARLQQLQAAGQIPSKDLHHYLNNIAHRLQIEEESEEEDTSNDISSQDQKGDFVDTKPDQVPSTISTQSKSSTASISAPSSNSLESKPRGPLKTVNIAKEEPIKWTRVEASLSGGSSSSSLDKSSERPPFYLTSSGATSSDTPQDEFRKYRPNPRLDIPMHIRRDPVLLYQYYKENFWDQAKVPGNDRHMQIRWNVRAVIENKPCWNGKIVDYLGPKAKNPQKRPSSAR